MHRPNDRVDVQAARRRGGTSPPPSPLPLLPFPPALGFDAPRRRVPQNATRRARNRCRSSRVHQLEESTSELGERAAVTKHESIGGHEVLPAAATAAAETEEVGEQRRGIHGRDVAVRCPGATQDLVDIVVDAGHRLPLAIHRYVRLDAGVPAGIDAAPGRLLRSSTASAGPAREKQRERERERKEERKSR